MAGVRRGADQRYGAGHGHEQTSTTLDRYTHASRDRDRRVRETLAAFSLPALPSQRPETLQGTSEEVP
jgi:hypothetical protein